MVEDIVGYTNLELLLNAEMQRQSLVASKVFRMSRARKLPKQAQLPYVYLGYALMHVGLLHNLTPPPGGKEPRLFTMFPYEKDVEWLSLLHTFGCLCHVVLDKKYANQNLYPTGPTSLATRIFMI
eukprot:g74831.t1